MKVEIGGKELQLFLEGNKNLLHGNLVAVVGSRNASHEALDWTHRLIEYWSRTHPDYIICSGLAKGIDAAAHEAALDFGMKTVAFIGTPLTRVYPKQHFELQQRIGQVGLLVSAWHPNEGEVYDPSRFIQRNRILAHFCKSAVVVHAANNSGTASTIGFFQSLNKPVYKSPLVDLPQLRRSKVIDLDELDRQPEEWWLT